MARSAPRRKRPNADSEKTRGRVVEVLRRGPRTLDELAETLHLTRTAIRLQLTALERDGLVAHGGVRPSRTKPANVYELTVEAEQGLSRAYVPVLTQLLHVLSARMSKTDFDEVMRSVGRELMTEQPRPRGDLRQRAEAASELLNQLGGLTEIDDDGDAIVIRSHGCPLAATAVDHPETCNAMESLVSEFVGAPVHQRCDRDGRPKCRFQLTA